MEAQANLSLHRAHVRRYGLSHCGSNASVKRHTYITGNTIEIAINPRIPPPQITYTVLTYHKCSRPHFQFFNGFVQICSDMYINFGLILPLLNFSDPYIFIYFFKIFTPVKFSCDSTIELQREKVYLLTCAHNKDSDQPVQMHRLIGVFVVCIKKLYNLSYPKSIQKMCLNLAGHTRPKVCF